MAAASLIRRTTGALGVLLLAAQLGAPATVAACAGDCDGSGTVDVSELVKGVNIALGSLPVSACTAFDLNGNGLVSVNELVAAVNALLDGCPAVTATPIRSTAAIPTATETALPSSSPTAAPSATSTPTATVNLPPVLPTASIYRTYPGFDISLPIGATDPDGDSVQCVASDLPAGASFDAQAGVLSWTPKNDQLGPFYVPFSCTDDGQPPESAAGLITFRVSALDACTMPTCDPATGCTSTLPAPTQLCCAAGPAARVAEPVAGCPQGRVVYVGQNANPESFGRLQNCDVMQVINFQQSGAEVQFHVEARCVNTLNRVHLRARMETKDRLLFDAEVLPFFLEAGPGDFASQRDLRLSVGGGGPFFDLQGAEANFTFTMTDSDSVAVSNSVRVLLTFTPRPDLPDVDPTLAPTATITATPTGTPG